MRRTQETLATSEQSELLRTKGLFRLLQAVFPNTILDTEPTKETVTTWVDTILAFWLRPESIQQMINLDNKITFIENSLSDALAQKAELAYRYAADSAPLFPAIELAESTYQVEIFKLILLTLMKSRVYPWVQYPIEKIDTGSILQKAVILKGLEIHKVLKIHQSNLYFFINSLDAVEMLCSEIEKKQTQFISNWVRFFAIGVNANFFDFPFDEQVRYLAKAVFGSDLTANQSVDKLIVMLNTEMQSETRTGDFWIPSMSSEVVYED